MMQSEYDGATLGSPNRGIALLRSGGDRGVGE